jgi:hypothetical protein
MILIVCALQKPKVKDGDQKVNFHKELILTYSQHYT